MASNRKMKILTKDELRRLMKQTQSGVKSKAKRIQHPLAKYNSLDRLVCSLCNCVIKSDLLWATHLTKQHKDILVQKQAASYPEVSACWKQPASQTDSRSNAVKSKDCDGSTNMLPLDVFDSSAKSDTTKEKTSFLADYELSYSDSTDEDDAIPQLVTSSQICVSPGLPSDVSGNSANDEVKDKPQLISEKLPEGFFDDPKLDAKVRQVEYKDKMNEEWEQFQRVMQEETHVSQVIMEEDDVQANLDRNIDEIDEQMTRWQEIENLHVKKEVVMQKMGDGQKDEDSDDDLLENVLDLFNWRAKSTCR